MTKQEEMTLLVEKYNNIPFEFDVFEFDDMTAFCVFVSNTEIDNADEITDAMNALVGTHEPGTNEYNLLENMIVVSDDIREDSLPRVTAICERFDMYNIMENVFETESQETIEEITAIIKEQNPSWVQNTETRKDFC